MNCMPFQFYFRLITSDDSDNDDLVNADANNIPRAKVKIKSEWIYGDMLPFDEFSFYLFIVFDKTIFWLILLF